MGFNEKKIVKILDKFDEKTLDELAHLCKYGTNTNSKTVKQITKIYGNYTHNFQSNAFLSKYIENLFFAYYNMARGFERKKYIDIENIIDSKHKIGRAHV